MDADTISAIYQESNELQRELLDRQFLGAKLEIDLDQVNRELAAVPQNDKISEFIFQILKSLKEIEDSASVGFPTSRIKFQQLIKSRFPSPKQPPELRKGVHFRRWIYVLHFGNTKDNEQLLRLRQELQFDRKKYNFFADQMQCLFNLFNEDILKSCSIDSEPFDNTCIPEFLKLFNTDMRLALQMFLNTR